MFLKKNCSCKPFYKQKKLKNYFYFFKTSRRGVKLKNFIPHLRNTFLYFYHIFHFQTYLTFFFFHITNLEENGTK